MLLDTSGHQIYIHIYIYVYIYTYMYIYIYIYIYTYICIYAGNKILRYYWIQPVTQSTYIYTYTCTFTHTCTFTFTYTLTYAYTLLTKSRDITGYSRSRNLPSTCLVVCIHVIMCIYQIYMCVYQSHHLLVINLEMYVYM